MKLHQFAISHYCEKVRWALDYKRIDHQVVNYIPGAHIKKIRSIAGDSIVPVLQHENETIQGSDQILDWLDQHYPEYSLTPTEASKKKEAQKWERFSDKEIGIPLRCYLYHYLLESPDILIPMLSAGRPFYEKIVLKIKYKTVNKLFRQFLNINHKTADKSLQRVTAAIETLHNEYSDKPYLVGDQFSRADLSVAAMVAPLIRAKNYGLEWPQQLPAKIVAIEEKLLPKLGWALSLYDQFRKVDNTHN